MKAPPPGLGGVKTSGSTRAKHRKTNKGRSHSHVRTSKWTGGSGKNWSLPPVTYTQGPFSIQIEQYAFRFWGIRGDESDVVLLTEVESATWDDASSVLTGSLTYMTPDWATKLGLREGHRIRCEVSDDDGHHFTPLWTMRLDAPNLDLMLRERTANLVSDLNRLAQSDDDFIFAKDKRRPHGWRGDEAIRSILTAYGFELASCPAFKTRITNWHLTDAHPLDVIHSILIHERNSTGRAYAISMDWRERVYIRSVKRPSSLLDIGPQLLAASYSAQHDPRFATDVTVRADQGVTSNKDSKGHRKPSYTKNGADVSSPSAIKLYGRIHRNLYSPDAGSFAKLSHEGSLFLAAIAKFKRQIAVSLPGMPSIARLDAFKVKLAEQGIEKIVYVADAKHNLDQRGYTVDATMVFADPFKDDKSLLILQKLSDTATSRGRKSPTTSGGKDKKTPKNHKARSGPPLGGVPTNTGHGAGIPQKKKHTKSTTAPRSRHR